MHSTPSAKAAYDGVCNGRLVAQECNRVASGPASVAALTLGWEATVGSVDSFSGWEASSSPKRRKRPALLALQSTATRS